MIGLTTAVKAQQVDSIYFHLYTDSLKKGQHNYINVDGKLANGNWMPLTSKEIQFSCAQASFEGNELVIPMDFKPEKVTVKAEGDLTYINESNEAKQIYEWMKGI